MFEKLKSLFGKRPEQSAPPAPASAPAPSQARPSAPSPAPSPAKPGASAAPIASVPAGETIALPLKSILNHLSPELQAFASRKPSAQDNVNAPLNRVLEQLAKGNVRFTFGELKQMSPAGIFSGGDEHDQTLIVFPLQDVLAKVNPSHLKLRPGQSRIDVPDDIKPVFGKDGKPSEPQEASAPTPAAAAPAPAPTAPPAPKPAAAAPAPFTPITPLAPAPAPKPPAPAPPPAVPLPPPPAQPIKPMAPLPDPAKLMPKPAAAAPIAQPPGEAGRLVVSFESFFASIPEVIRNDFGGQCPAGVGFYIPVEIVDPMMKKGKVVFPWSELRGWSRPAIDASVGAIHAGTPVEIPLKIVIPQFMAARKPAAGPQKTVSVAENIPDVFAAKIAATAAPAAPAAAPAAPAPAAPAPAPAPVASAPAPAAPRSNLLGEIFGQPAKQDWSHAEIAQNTAKLPGVAGAIIAMPDGLKVASQLPPEISADGFAGFMPAIFSRVGQYTKDLSLGETTQIKVQMGAKPLYIFKTAKLFFAVLGRAGEAVPEAKLEKIATQLDQ